MKTVKRVNKSLANAFVIGILVLASLVVMTNVFVITPGDMCDSPAVSQLPTAEGTARVDCGEASVGTREANEDDDDFVDLYRISGDPQILIDGAAPGVNDIYVGEPNVQLDIPVRSIKPENADDNDGDDILYNVTVSIDSTATTCWDSSLYTWVPTTNCIVWDAYSVSPQYKEDGANCGNCLLIDGMPGNSKYIPWFYNDYGTPDFLDRDNDQRADNNEFYQIYDDYKMYEGFQFDVAGDATPGIYNISVEITYKYQTFQNVSTQRLSGGGGVWYDPDTEGPSGTGDLGIFDYYFWEPYFTAGGSVDFNVPGNIDFRKRSTYFETNAAPAGAYWEAIPDLGYNNDNPNNYNTQGGTWDYQSNYDGDGDTTWNDGATGNLGTVVSNWNTRGINDYASGAGQSYIDRTCDQYPYNVADGNGTWHYSGYEGDTVWSTLKTEIEYIEIRVEHGIDLSEPYSDNCQLCPDPSHPYYLKAGDEFKKMYLTINNQDMSHHMTDVYVNITLDDMTHFSLKHNWAWKDQISSSGNDNFYYRMDAITGAPVNRYTGMMTCTFTRENVRITEELPIEYILYYTPDLTNYDGTPITPDELTKVIHTGQADTNVDFSITNCGNTVLENGILTMDFSDFKHSGDE